jgi:hypothetical protein
MRVRRRKMSPAVLRLSKIADRAQLRARALSAGIARQLERCYDYDDLKQVLDLIAIDLKPAFEADRDAQAAYGKLRASRPVGKKSNRKKFAIPNPVRGKSNRKRSGAKK